VQWLVDIHLALAILLMAGGLGLAVDALRRRREGTLPDSFWRGATHLERAVVLQALIGVSLYIFTHNHPTWTHYLYGAVALVVILVERGLRPGRALRETLTEDYGRFNEPVVMAVLYFFLFGVFARGFMTGLWNF